MEYKIKIPKEFFAVFKFVQEKATGIAAINIALSNFEPKFVFGWHLSIMLHLEDVNDFGMPNDFDNRQIEIFEDNLNQLLNPIIGKPNALFLGRITWNGTIELIWKIHCPDIANSIIQSIIEKNEYPLYFDFRIDPDENWNLSEWHLRERE